MPSQNKTPLGLSQWVGADRPKRDDFNTDNQKIDLACRSVLEGLAGHLESGSHITESQQQRWNTAAGHTGEGIATEGGIHGLRYFGGRLEVNVGGVWIPCATGEGETPVDYKVYGVCVDTQNPDPNASVTYTDDAKGMQPGDAAWRDTFLGSMRPCLLKQGTVVHWLDPNNYSRDTHGNPVDITTGDAGDVMVEIPRMAYAIYKEGGKLYVKVTDHPDAAKLDSRFCYNAHTRAVQGDRQALYVGAYLACALGGRLRSLSGKKIADNQPQRAFREQARENGDGYDMLGYYPFVLLQCLCLIYAGGRNAQQIMGAGFTQERGDPLFTGGTDSRGLFFGESAGTLQMKAFGIEDLWGNVECFVDGVRTDSGGFIQTATQSFSRNESWRNTGKGGGTAALSYISQVMGDNETAFLMEEGGATTTTGWCDSGERYPGCIALVGGYYYSRSKAGPFYTLFLCPDTQASIDWGTRLMYL